MALGWRGQYFRYREYFLNIVALYKSRADLKAFLEIILSLGTIVVFLLFALKPTALTIISLYNQIQDKKKTITALNQKVTDLQTANGVFLQNQNFIPDIDSAVPNAPKPDAVSQQILALSAKDTTNILGISVSQITLVGSAPVANKGLSNLKALPNGANEMPASISITGSFANLSSFIKDFENLRLVPKFDALGISASDTPTGRVIVAVISTRFPFLGK